MGTPGAKAKSGSSIVGPQKSGCFSGGANRNGSIEKFYPSQSQDMILSGQGPSKTDPEKKPTSKTPSQPKEIKLKEPKVPAGSATSYTKQSIKDVIKSQQEYDANTKQVTRNLAELDSLKMVAKGQESGARSLYGREYDSSKPLDGVNIGKGTNSGYGGGLDFSQNKNIGKLREEAKKIQGPRPSLGANKIHSSKGYGINKILGDLDKSGDLSAYEAKRQAAIDKNMSKGSTKKGYKH
jgi:hypothetical protein